MSVTLNKCYDIPNLYISRYLGGEGGSVATLMEFLSKGQVPPPAEVASWMEPSETPSEKIGLYVDADNFIIKQSVFTGQQRVIPHVPVQRVSVEALSDGRMKQTFKLEPADFVLASIVFTEDFERPISLVTQIIKPGDFDASLKRTVELPSPGEMFVKEGFFDPCEKSLGGI